MARMLTEYTPRGTKRPLFTSTDDFVGLSLDITILAHG